jgi:predicted small secreted protein
MTPRRSCRALAALGLLGLAPALPACNTIAGLGRDLQAAGGGIVGSSETIRQGRAAPQVAARQDRATPEEVIQRVRQAARDIAGSGEAGLATFRAANATSVWKDSYTFVLSCEGGTAVTAAHPVRPDLDGRPVAEVLTFGPRPGEQMAADWCAAGRRPQGGWVEYEFPKPGETRPSRKVSYLLAAEGTPYVVGAGLYDESAKVEDLDKLAGDQP